MNPCWVYAKQCQMPRDQAAHLMLDLAAPRPNNWAVAVTHKGQIYASAARLSAEDADAAYEMQDLIPGPAGDASWGAVLQRLMQQEEPAADWAPVNLATNFFPIGSWNWLVTLKIIRAAIAANSGEQHAQ